MWRFIKQVNTEHTRIPKIYTQLQKEPESFVFVQDALLVGIAITFGLIQCHTTQLSKCK